MPQYNFEALSAVSSALNTIALPQYNFEALNAVSSALNTIALPQYNFEALSAVSSALNTISLPQYNFEALSAMSSALNTIALPQYNFEVLNTMASTLKILGTTNYSFIEKSIKDINEIVSSTTWEELSLNDIKWMSDYREFDSSAYSEINEYDADTVSKNKLTHIMKILESNKKALYSLVVILFVISCMFKETSKIGKSVFSCFEIVLGIFVLHEKILGKDNK